MRITETVVNRPIAVVILFALFIGLAAFLVPNIPVELFPDMERPIVMVQTIYKGAGPEDVERNITEVLEKQLSNVSDLESISSTSSEGKSIVKLEFSFSKDLDDATTDIIVRVDVSENRLEAYNMTLSNVAGKLSAQNYQLGSGSIEDGEREFLIRTDEEFDSLDEIKNVIIATINSTADDPGQIVRLKDVATVIKTYADENNRVYINGNPGITIQITKESDANSVSVSDAVQNNIASINKGLPVGVELIILSDSSSSIRSTMDTTYSSLIQGIILAMLVLFLFLRTWGSTIIIGLSIPISIFITILFMYFMDLSINLMTLTGLILGLGMVVDCSIVILENIFRYRLRGTKLTAAAVLGSKEMISAITASTLTTICVFIPIILFADDLGMIGQIFTALSYTIIIALSVSLLVAITLVPTLSAHFITLNTRVQKPLKNKVIKAIDSKMERGFDLLDLGYKKILRQILNHKVKVLVLTLLIFIASLIQFSSLGIILAPPMSEDSLTISMELPLGTSLDETEYETMQLVSLIENEIGGYENIIVTIGGSLTNEASVELVLPSFDEQTVTVNQMKTMLRNHFNDFPAATLEFTSRGPGMGNSNPVDLLITSDDNDAAINAAEEIKNLIIEYLPRITEPSTDVDAGVPQIEVSLDRDRAYALGLDMYSVAREISAGLNGVTATTYRIGGDELDVIVLLQEDDRNSRMDLEKIFVKNNKGEKIALSNIATLTNSKGPVAINREDEKRIVHVVGGLADNYASTVAQADIEALLKEYYVVPDGVSYSLGGDFKDIADQTNQLLIIFIIAALLVFGVMAAQFESLKDPFIIILTMPLMIVGVVIFYTISGLTFSIMSAVGLVVLAGLVVNSGIVLVDYTNLLLKRGYHLVDACVEAGGNRLKPILMTSATTILGMAPLAFFGGAGTEQVQPIAQTIVGGLLISGIMTLFVTPVIFAVFNKRKYS
ncbi:MAG: hypothetical protein B6229_07875 [Spirochaetaceae bacterium 4572_7]|nr:MAG: hypothetical protein B6229_07875 [Spirochaetaceae bacterium 4572_7]